MADAGAVKRVETGGPRIVYEDSGAGPAVLLGHSFLCSGAMWAPQVPALAARYRVLNVDARGHGASGPATAPFSLYDMVDDMVAVLDDAGVERATWMGLSIGGMVALRAALTVPGRVAGLVLLDSHAGAETAWKKAKYSLMALGVRALGVRALLPAILPLFFAPETFRRRPELVAEYRGRFAAADVPSMLQGLETLKRRDSVVDRLGEIDAPALVVVGARDRSLPPPCSRQIAAGLPRATYVEIPAAGHLASLEQPERVTREVLEFLDGPGAG